MKDWFVELDRYEEEIYKQNLDGGVRYNKGQDTKETVERKGERIEENGRVKRTRRGQKKKRKQKKYIRRQVIKKRQ